MATSSEIKKLLPEAKRVTGGQRHFSDPTEQHADPHQHPQHQDPDLFSFLSSMHLTNQIQTNTTATAVTMPHPVMVASRKRKILDGGGHGGFGSGGSGKINGMRHPVHRRGSGDDDIEAPLQTPQCSQSGMLQPTYICTVGNIGNFWLITKFRFYMYYKFWAAQKS